MKFSMQPGNGSTLAFGERPWAILAATTILAVAVGASIAGANWMVIAVLVALPIFLVRPRDLCLGVYAFLLPFDSITAVGPAGQTLTLMAGAALLAVLLLTSLVKKDMQRVPKQAWWWVAFVVWAGITVLWSMEWIPASGRLPTAISLVLLFLVALSSNITAKELRTVSLFAIAGACVAAAYASFQFYGGANYHDEIRGSLMAGEKAADPNFFAASLLLPLSLAVNGVLTPRRWLSRLGWLAIAGGLAFGVLVTMSRGAMVAMAVMILFYVFTSQVSRRMTIVVLAIFVGLGFAMPGVFFARLQSAADTGGAGRTVVWQGGLVAFQHFAVLGAGLNNFPYAYRKYIGGAPIYHGTLMSAAHNTYLEIAVELGIIGLALMLTAVISQLRAARRARKELPKAAGSVIVAYEAACYAILTAAFFIDIVWEKWFWLAWILLAVAVRTSRIEQQAVPAPARVTETARLRWYDWPARSTPRTRVP